MVAKSALLMRVLMNRYYQGSPDLFLSHIYKEGSQKIAEQQTSAQNPEQAIIDPMAAITKIHYSWLATPISQFSSKMQPLIVSALPKQSALPLNKLLHMPESSSPSLPIRRFLVGLLYEKLNATPVLPPAFLPQTTLSMLATLKKNQLIEIIDFLGMYDLVEEIRYIVDKKKLKTIYNCLSLKKQHFLRICLHQKDKLTTARIGIEKWTGECQQLNRILHKRGLIRLGYALSGQHRDLLWHVMHSLDSGRGNLLHKYWSKAEIPGVTAALHLQVLNVINFLKKMSDA